MKVYVKSGKDPRTTGTANVYKVADAMGWHKPWWIRRSSNGYVCIDFDWPSTEQMRKHFETEEYKKRYGFTVKFDLTEVEQIAAKLNISYKEAKDIWSEIRHKVYPTKVKQEQQKILDEIREKTGLDCHFTKSLGYLVVPFADKTTTRFR